MKCLSSKKDESRSIVLDLSFSDRIKMNSTILTCANDEFQKSRKM